MVRTALVMATLTQQPLKLVNIRCGTSHPGLDIEDIVLLKALSASCKAAVEGGDIGSQVLSYSPTRPIGKFEIGSEPKKQSRGANTLVILSTLLPVVAKCGAFVELSAIGETYGPNTLTFDYFANVTLSAARKMGAYAWTDQMSTGFGRESVGEVHMEAEPSVITGVNWLNRGNLVSCHAIVTTSNLADHVAQRGTNHLERLANYSNVPCRVESKSVGGLASGAAVTVWCEFENGIGGAAVVGSRGVRIETVAQGAFEGMASFLESKASVDAHLADQMFLLGMIAEGETSFVSPRITRRLTTMAWVAKQFLPIHILISGSEGTPGSVSIQR